MAIKPILFNTEMVRAILDGRKTCTRRICKDANEYTVPDMDFYNADRRTYAVHNFADKEQMEQLSTAERTCPICPGDILYVRETWEHFDCCCCEGDEHGNCYQEPLAKHIRECNPNSSLYYGIMIAIPEYRDPADEYENPTPLDTDTGWKLEIILPCRQGERKRSITEMLFYMLRSGH